MHKGNGVKNMKNMLPDKVILNYDSFELITEYIHSYDNLRFTMKCIWAQFKVYHAPGPTCFIVIILQSL